MPWFSEIHYHRSVWITTVSDGTTINLTSTADLGASKVNLITVGGSAWIFRAACVSFAR